MIAKASAPAKTILFGEHSVVYGEPAIAGAVNKRAYITIKESDSNFSVFKAPDIGFEAELLTRQKKYILTKGKPGIIRYILEALYVAHDHSPIEITLSSKVPIGSGLGSSAAVTVATLAALYRYHNVRFNKKSLAHDAHMVEQAVQGVASPLDTLVSTYGGLVYLSRNKKVERFNVNFNVPFVVGYTTKHGNTGKMVKDVRNLKTKNPSAGACPETLFVQRMDADAAFQRGNRGREAYAVPRHLPADENSACGERFPDCGCIGCDGHQCPALPECADKRSYDGRRGRRADCCRCD